MDLTRRLIGVGALGSAAASHYSQGKDELKRLSNKYLGQDPTMKDKGKVMAQSLGPAMLSTAFPLAGTGASLISTPEAIVQKKRRKAMEDAFKRSRGEK